MALRAGFSTAYWRRKRICMKQHIAKNSSDSRSPSRFSPRASSDAPLELEPHGWQEGAAKLTLESSATGDLERVVLRCFEQLEVDRIPGIPSRMYWERVLQLMVAETGGLEREEWRHPPEATPAPGASASAPADGRDPSRITLLEACRQDGT